MTWARTLALLALPLLFSCQRPAQKPKPEKRDFYLGGIQIREDDAWLWTHTLKRAGMNTVATTVYAKQGAWDSAALKEDEAPWVVDEIRAAKAAGLSVVLILRVSLDHAVKKNRLLWHGMIMPKSDDALALWFQRYQDFVVRWAKIAQAEGVDVLGIGSEMSALTSTKPLSKLPPLEAYYLSKEKQEDYLNQLLPFEPQISHAHIASLGARPGEDLRSFIKRRQSVWETWAKVVSYQDAPDSHARANTRRKSQEQHWRRLIAKTREHYSGRLTYAANFDQYDRVTFWDALDMIGINAYFQLRSHPKDEVSLAAFERRWGQILGKMTAFKAEFRLGQKPILFTELGYTYRRNSTIEPWGQNGFTVFEDRLLLWGEEPQNMQERALSIRALYNASLRSERISGLLYWKLSTIRDHLQIEPFVMIVEEESRDPMQSELVRFTKERYLDP